VYFQRNNHLLKVRNPITNTIFINRNGKATPYMYIGRITITDRIMLVKIQTNSTNQVFLKKCIERTGKIFHFNKFPG
jgi:hypothetical protein